MAPYIKKPRRLRKWRVKYVLSPLFPRKWSAEAKKIYKFFLGPLVNVLQTSSQYAHFDVQNILDEIFDTENRPIDTYKACRDFKMPGELIVRPQLIIKGMGKRDVVRHQTMLVRIEKARKFAEIQLFHSDWEEPDYQEFRLTLEEAYGLIHKGTIRKKSNRDYRKMREYEDEQKKRVKVKDRKIKRKRNSKAKRKPQI